MTGMLYCSIQPVRERKSRLVMEALCKGWGEPAKVCIGDPPDDGNPFAIYGQIWGAERLLPKAIKSGRPFWYIDNGFWRPGCGGIRGYYRICYRAMQPVFLRDCELARGAMTGVAMMPWRKSGKHILFALPSRHYGTALGLSMDDWIAQTRNALRAMTDRPVIERDKGCPVLLAEQIKDCWAVVTHSSGVAVEAVLAGVPVFVADGSAAAPVGNLDLAKLEQPAMPDNRDQWWASLMCQQFMPAEMADGTAYRLLSGVREQIEKVAA